MVGTSTKLAVHFRDAVVDDVPTLWHVVNDAYRTSGGWTGESHLIEGQRISEAELTSQINEKQIKIIVAEILGEDKKPEIVGCVAAKHFADKEVEIGMLAVPPRHQSGGVGSQLIRAATERGKKDFEAVKAVVSVVNVRADIMAWYKRLGFVESGETLPFPAGYVCHVPIHFILMKKDIT